MVMGVSGVAGFLAIRKADEAKKNGDTETQKKELIKTGVAVGVGSLASPSSVAMVAPLAVSGPLGWVCLGAEPSAITYDCWKPILREMDPAPSKGRTIASVVEDPRVKKVTLYNDDPENLSMVVQNIWDEKFYIGAVHMPDGSIAAHASPVIDSYQDDSFVP